MSNYTFSKNGKFPNGINIPQLEELIRNSNIVCSCLGTIVYGNDVIIGFNTQLSAGEVTTLNTLIDTFIPRADVLYSGVIVDSITYANSPYTIGHNSVSCDTSGGNIIIYLKKANRSRNGMHAIEKYTSDINTVTIIPHGSDLINGSSSAVISTYRECLIIQSDGTNWIFNSSTTSIIQTENEGTLDITNNKGDLTVDDGTRQQALSVGANNEALIADSTATLGVKWATINHTTLNNIGTNTHAQIDSHISTTTAHGVTGAIVGTTSVQTVLNKTMTDNSNNLIARSLWSGSGSGSVSVYVATAPTTGQVLTATNGTTATWQTPSGGIFGSQFAQASLATEFSTTSTSFITALTLTTASIPAGTYRIGFYYEYRGSSTNFSVGAQVQIDNTTIIHNMLNELKDSAATQSMSQSGFYIGSLTAATHTIDIDLRSSSASATAFMKEMRIEIWRIA